MSRTVHHDFRNAVKLLRKEPAALAVYMIYVSRMDNQAVAFPSIRGLSKDTGWSTRKVQDARTYLTTMGLLTRIDNPSDNPMDRRAFYRVNDSFEYEGKTYYTLFNGAQVPDVRDEKEHMHVLPNSTPRTTPSNVDAVARKVVPPSEGKSIPNGIEPAAKAAAKRKKSKANPRSAELEPDIIYETVETHIFGIEGTPDMPYQWSGRCGQITSWLKGAVASVDGQEVGKISRPAAPEHIKAFARAWVKEHTGAPLPRKPDRFVEHWRAWASKQAGARPRTNLQEATAEDRAALIREVMA